MVSKTLASKKKDKPELFRLDGPNIMNDVGDESSFDHPAAKLLGWHHRLSHISMRRLQRMATQGLLPKRLATCHVPICQSCTYGKATRRAWRTKRKTETVTAEALGQCVSVDQLESTLPGLVGQMKGRLTRDRFRVATIFVDNFNNYSNVHLQESTNSAETLEAKVAFELLSASYGVKILHYRGDNSRFADNMWRQDIAKKSQQLSFCGVGAHHQNGRAEKRIRDLQNQAITSLIHANRRWHEAIDARLWPNALRAADEAIINTPFAGQDLIPLELFARTQVSPHLQDQHLFGCLVYVLDGRLQFGSKTNKWAMRSRLGIYVGKSTQHSQSVGLVLSMTTGLVSPQFHVVYDNHFETIHNDKNQNKSLWQSLCGFEKLIEKHQHTQTKADIPITELLPINELNPLVTQLPSENNQGPAYDASQQKAAQDPVVPERLPVTTTRSGRNVFLPSRYDDFVGLDARIYDSTELDSSLYDPLSLAVSSDPDVMYLNQALKQPDKKQFIEAMRIEVKSHTDNKSWRVIKRSQVPSHQKVLPDVWAMRRKRDIATQQVYKWKARLNVHGSKQTKGLNYRDTYAPVASWASIR
jgi:GAG-pre-integrase domain